VNTPEKKYRRTTGKLLQTAFLFISIEKKYNICLLGGSNRLKAWELLLLKNIVFLSSNP
jgi:hypothetical protein